MKNMVKTLNNIKFPVFPIPTRGNISTSGTKCIYTTKTGSIFIIDDSSLSGSLGIRRLQITEKLLPLKKAILTIGNLILYSKIYNTFIDCTGKLFKYKRKYTVPLIVREITQVIPYKSGCILNIKNIHCPILFYRPVDTTEKYAVLAIVGRGYILLGINARNYLRNKTIKI